jgi:hypothetical protein
LEPIFSSYFVGLGNVQRIDAQLKLSLLCLVVRLIQKWDPHVQPLL